jgi:hypothetical protein
MNLVRELDRYDPKWRENISPDPLEAGVEVGLIEAEDLDDDCQPLDFGD